MILSIVAALVAFVLALLLGVPYIDFLKKKMLGQYIEMRRRNLTPKKAELQQRAAFFL